MGVITTIPELLKIKEETGRKAFDQFGFDMRVAGAGIVQSYNPGPPATCTIQLAIRERLNIDGDISSVQLPLLVDVPVLFPGAGGYAITWPLVTGDEGLVIFLDNCYDAFWQSGGIQNEVDKRRHDLSDAMFFPTRISKPSSFAVTNTLQVRNAAGTAFFEINGTALNITTSGAVTITSSGNTVVNSSGDADITASGTVNLSGSSTVIQSKNFIAHTHSGVQSGAGTTGGVV